MDRRRIALPERKRRRIEAQQKRRAVAKLARKPKEKNVAERRQQLAEAQQRFWEHNKKSSLEKCFTDSLDVICCVCKRIFWRSTLKVLQSSQVEFLRAEGYDQLGEDEKKVLECGNCFNDISREHLPRYAISMAFFTRICQICPSWMWSRSVSLPLDCRFSRFEK